MKHVIFVILFSVFTLSEWNSYAQETNQTKTRKISVSDSTKSGYQANFKVGNPTNKDIEMVLDDYAYDQYRYDLKYSDGWYAFKKQLKEKHNLQLTFNYSSIFLGATNKVNEDSKTNAASGIFDATLKWDVVNGKSGKNVGSFVCWIDWRHLYYSDVKPQFLFQETGSANLSAVKFNKWKPHVLEFYYQQGLFDNRMGIVIGKIDMPDWFNFNALAHPNLHFTDMSFLVSPTISWSNPGFGIAMGGWINKKKTVALLAGINDVAGVDVNDPKFFDLGTDNWSDMNFLKMVEIAYSPSRAQYYSSRISATFWHSDMLMRSDDYYFQTPSSRGVTFQASWNIEDKYLPVFSMGFSDGDGANATSKVNISLSNAFDLKSHDLLGAGINYTKSSITDRNQYMSEIFYRWTWSKTTHLTPLVKFVVNPALDPNADFTMYYGVRSRISF